MALMTPDDERFIYESLGVRITYHNIFTCTHFIEISGMNVILLSCFQCLYIFCVVLELRHLHHSGEALLKGQFTQMRFSNRHNCSAVSQGEIIPPCANTVEAYSGHVLKDEENNRTKACLHTASVVSPKYPEGSEVQFLFKRQH